MREFLFGVLSASILAGAIGVVRGASDDNAVLVAPSLAPPKAASHARNAVWEAAVPRIRQAELDCLAAVESQVAGINEFFTERKQGARPFATAVLGTEGKLQATGALAEKAAGALGELFGSKPSRVPDSFTLYVGRSFRQHVLDTEQLQKAIDGAVASYEAEVRRLEAKLLVDLRADLDDASLDIAGALHEIRAGNAVAGHGNAMISKAIEAAVGDYSATIVKFAVSMVISNAVSDRLTRDGDSTLEKLGINFAVGVGVDKALDEALARGGYDPEGDLAARITSSLDQMRFRLIEGDPQAVKAYLALRGWRRTHPDAIVRTACRKATDAIEHSGAAWP